MVSVIQSVRFDKRIWSPKAAKLWLKMEKFKPLKRVDVSKNFYRYRLEQPEHFNYFITKKIPGGIEFVIAFK